MSHDTQERAATSDEKQVVAGPDGTPRSGAHDALTDALTWFHQQLDRTMPEECDYDTPRNYYRIGRGWNDETISGNLLGYAPANCRDALVSHLFDRGHGREAILATGLFGERDGGNLYATWRGRYVFPYFGFDGRPVFAISRATDSDHPADWKDNKYDKLPVSREDVVVQEPIYGLDSVEPDEPVLITEGIADAITAQEAGYSCISPVTVQFKEQDREALREALAERDVDRVYLIQDAERPTSHLDDHDRLSLQQVGDGVTGAVRTAAYLSSYGFGARVANLPRPGLDKVDLDDYLQSWSDDLTPLLASAKPVEDHPAYDASTAKEIALDAADATSPSRNRDAIETDNAHSALFQLEIPDVTNLSWDYRGPSPLGHHGDSEDYFVLLKRQGVAYDHKYKVAYNALTYLLVDANERHPRSPNGELKDNEVFAAWRHAKERGLIPDDDPIPRRGLRYVARDTTDWDGTLVEHETQDDSTFDGLPTAVYNSAINAVREDHGLDPGRSPVGRRSDPDAEPVAPIAMAKLDSLATPDREQLARKHGLEPPSTADARARLRDILFRELRAENQTVIDAPTALGKSHTVATTPWRDHADVTGGAPIIHLHPTREARDDAAEKTGDSAAVGAVLKGRKDRCPVARGDHDPPEADNTDPPEQVVTINGEPANEWFDRQCNRKGLAFASAHAYAREHNDQGRDALPCCESGECPARTQWEGLPSDDDGEPAVDVIHATHQFAYVPSLRCATNLISDEQPDFTVELSQDRIRRMVNAYLPAIDAPANIRTWEAFVSLAKHTSCNDDAAHERDALANALGAEPDQEWYVTNPDAHAYAPGLVRAIWNAMRWEDDNTTGRRSASVFHTPPRLDASEGAGHAGVWLSVTIDAENIVQTVRAIPDLSRARAVIGLDAHPCMILWELNVPGVSRETVLEPTERRQWRRYERGLTVVQVGEATRPRSGSKAREWMHHGRIRAVLERLRDHYGDAFGTVITTRQVECTVRQHLETVAGNDAIDADSTMHYGEEKSRNDFADETVGYLYGCMDPGDGWINDAIAEAGLEAAPVRIDCDHCDATGECSDDCNAEKCRTETAQCGMCDSDGRTREKGRTFEGPDADIARAVLASVRENQVAQAAGRYARSPGDPQSGAVVYAHIDALPSGFVDFQVPGVKWLATEMQRAIIDALADQPDATTRELADIGECTKEHVRQTLARLEDHGLVTRDPGAGAHGADIYRDDGAEHALVDIGGQITNDHLQGSSRRSLVISAMTTETSTSL